MRLNSAQAERAVRKLRDRMPQTIARALNRAGTTARTAMQRVIASDMGIKAGVARDAMRVELATATSLVHRIGAKGTRIPLVEFGARGPQPSRGKGRGVTARMPGGRGRYPHAFLATMRGGPRAGKKAVLMRKGRERTPVKELFGASIGHVFGKHLDTGLTAGQASLIKNLQSEINYAMKSLES